MGESGLGTAVTNLTVSGEERWDLLPGRRRAASLNANEIRERLGPVEMTEMKETTPAPLVSRELPHTPATARRELGHKPDLMRPTRQTEHLGATPGSIYVLSRHHTLR